MLGVPRTSRYNLVVGKEVEQTQRFHTVKFISASDLFASPLVFGLIVLHGTKMRVSPKKGPPFLGETRLFWLSLL